MTRLSRGMTVLFVMTTLLLASCATTQITSVWKDPAYHTRPEKVMVIGVAKNPLNRRLFEDEFVLRLRGKGTGAIASYQVLADQQQDDQAAIAAKVRELGADTVLITRLVSKRTVKTYVPGTIYYPPPYYDTWPDYYGYGYRYLYSPGYVTEDEYAVIETNLYEAAHDRLIWAASSETALFGADQDLIREYIDVMVDSMAKAGLLTE